MILTKKKKHVLFPFKALKDRSVIEMKCPLWVSDWSFKYYLVVYLTSEFVWSSFTIT